MDWTSVDDARSVSICESTDAAATEFCDVSATELLSRESSDTSDATVWPTACDAGTLHEASLSRLSSELTMNSSDLVLRSLGRFNGVGPISAPDVVSLPAGDGTPVEQDGTMTSGVVVTGGVATRLVPLDGDGVASVAYISTTNVEQYDA